MIRLFYASRVCLCFGAIDNLMVSPSKLIDSECGLTTTNGPHPRSPNPNPIPPEESTTALELESTLSGIPIPKGVIVYPSLCCIQNNLRKHLGSRGLNFNVDAQLTSPVYIPSTILATSWNHKPQGPPPEVVKGKRDGAIHE